MSTPSTPGIKDLLCLDLYAASRAIIKAYGPLLRELDLTYPQFLVMVSLWESGSLPIKAIGEKLSLDSGTLSPLLKRLEQAGLLRRQRSQLDERGVDISLTPAGKALAPKAASVFQSMGCRLAMNPADIRRLQETLRDISIRFDEDKNAAQSEASEAGKGGAQT